VNEVEAPAKKVTVTVTYNGVDRVLEVNPHQAIQAVLEHAMNEFEITANRHMLALFRGTEELVDLAKSVEDYGIKQGDKLVLSQSQVRGG
jgi:predicted CoA-binding protein